MNTRMVAITAAIPLSEATISCLRLRGTRSPYLFAHPCPTNLSHRLTSPVASSHHAKRWAKT
jgi:hypothetical protein